MGKGEEDYEGFEDEEENDVGREEDEEVEGGSSRKRSRAQFINVAAKEDEDEDEDEDEEDKDEEEGGVRTAKKGVGGYKRSAFIDDVAQTASEVEDEENEEEEGLIDHDNEPAADVGRPLVHHSCMMERKDVMNEVHEEYARMLEARYRKATEGAMEEVEAGVEQQARLPSVRDPKSWLVRCKVGSWGLVYCCLLWSVSITPTHAQTQRDLPQAFLSPASSPEPAYASLSVQTAEGEALIQLRKSLGDHPAFQGLTLYPNNSLGQTFPRAEWAFVEEAGIPFYRHVPCGAATWAWVGCNAAQRVVSINLNGPYMSQVNSSWSKSNGLPLRGYVPWATLSRLQDLELFDIGYQEVSGGLEGIGNVTALQTLVLSSNNFTGPLPDGIGQLQQLQTLLVDGNQLTGPIESSTASLAHLTLFVASGNSFSGPFPIFSQSLQSLQSLDLSSTKLQGSLPDSWSQFTALTTLQLQGTTINGTIPPSWSNLKSLANVVMYSCHLTGPYPSFLTTLPSVKEIWLSYNMLYGPLPNNTILGSLNKLYLDNNYFNGLRLPTPGNMSNFTMNLDGNCFENEPANTSRPQSECAAFYQSLQHTAPGPAPTTLPEPATIPASVTAPMPAPSPTPAIAPGTATAPTTSTVPASAPPHATTMSPAPANGPALVPANAPAPPTGLNNASPLPSLPPSPPPPSSSIPNISTKSMTSILMLLLVNLLVT